MNLDQAAFNGCTQQRFNVQMVVNHTLMYPVDLAHPIRHSGALLLAVCNVSRERDGHCRTQARTPDIVMVEEFVSSAQKRREKDLWDGVTSYDR